jgi:hypothetical protein
MSANGNTALDELLKCVEITDNITEDLIGYSRQELVQIRTSNQRMADVVSAAVRWRQVVMAKELPSSDCDCVNCELTRAVEIYVRESK